MLTWGGSGLCSAACPAQVWTLWWWKFLGCRTNLASSFYTRTLKAFGTWTHTACMAFSYDSTLYKQIFFLVRILLRIAQMTKKISFSPWTAPALQITERKNPFRLQMMLYQNGVPSICRHKTLSIYISLHILSYYSSFLIDSFVYVSCIVLHQPSCLLTFTPPLPPSPAMVTLTLWPFSAVLNLQNFTSSLKVRQRSEEKGLLFYTLGRTEEVSPRKCLL